MADPYDFSDKYNTPLTIAEETDFLMWAEAADKLRDVYDYDLRGAWKAGLTADKRGHLPDTFKKPNHPTFSNESIYNGVDGQSGGQWSKQDGKHAFIPGQTNLDMYGAKALMDYFKRVEPGVMLLLPKQ